jgi:NTP pyrophosphatase (non-canonical NTP hydrolase)
MRFIEKLYTLREQLSRWQERNFPSSTKEQMALGVVEEVGELVHPMLKLSQGIRVGRDREKAERMMKDAVGDIAIYALNLLNVPRYGEGVKELREVEPVLRMAHALLFALSHGVGTGLEANVEKLLWSLRDLCMAKGWSMERIVLETSKKVTQRDWLRDPSSGGSGEEHKAVPPDSAPNDERGDTPHSETK